MEMVARVDTRLRNGFYLLHVTTKTSGTEGDWNVDWHWVRLQTTVLYISSTTTFGWYELQ